MFVLKESGEIIMNYGHKKTKCITSSGQLWTSDLIPLFNVVWSDLKYKTGIIKALFPGKYKHVFCYQSPSNRAEQQQMYSLTVWLSYLDKPPLV